MTILITGSTDGIGLLMQLAPAGTSIPAAFWIPAERDHGWVSKKLRLK